MTSIAHRRDALEAWAHDSLLLNQTVLRDPYTADVLMCGDLDRMVAWAADNSLAASRAFCRANGIKGATITLEVTQLLWPHDCVLVANNPLKPASGFGTAIAARISYSDGIREAHDPTLLAHMVVEGAPHEAVDAALSRALSAMQEAA